MKVVALSGGVGGAKMADGLAGLLSPDDLIVIVNVADDFEWFGLTICPDLDTVMYTLAGIEQPDSGYGIQDDTFACMDSLSRLNAPSWFRVGDQDLATHLVRSRWLWEGSSITQVTQRLCRARGIAQRILPATDDLLRTMVDTEVGELEFQEYFVHQLCQPVVKGFRFRGLETAVPTDAVMLALREADLIVVCPSNPFVSMGPILALAGVRETLSHKHSIAVSPIIGGRAVKGPAAKMFKELGREPSAVEVAREYLGIVSGLIVDCADQSQVAEINRLGIKTMVTDTFMGDRPGRRRLASALLEMGGSAGWE
jgi:LPPG:FO 2-phospho-L-lactate transferase